MARNFSIPELRRKALSGDVSFDMGRIYANRIRENDPEVIAILGLGHVVEARNWIEATTEEAMEFGEASREKRIQYAAEQARLAGMELSDIVEIFNLAHLVPAEMLQPVDPS